MNVPVINALFLLKPRPNSSHLSMGRYVSTYYSSIYVLLQVALTNYSWNWLQILLNSRHECMCALDIPGCLRWWSMGSQTWHWLVASPPCLQPLHLADQSGLALNTLFHPVTSHNIYCLRLHQNTGTTSCVLTLKGTAWHYKESLKVL